MLGNKFKQKFHKETFLLSSTATYPKNINWSNLFFIWHVVYDVTNEWQALSEHKAPPIDPCHMLFATVLGVVDTYTIDSARKRYNFPTSATFSA